MSMLESFFDCSRDSREVFRGLRIMDQTDVCSEWMNRYPVLFLSFKDVEALHFEGAYRMLLSLISAMCKKHIDLVEHPAMNRFERDVFNRLCAKTASLDEVKGSLETMTRVLSTVYGKPVIVLIDEYDVPLAKAQENGYYREMLDVMRGIFSAGLKTNPYLKLAVVTGCLRISKESVFTGVNHFASFSILSEDFSDAFGFTADEVMKLLTEAGFEDRLDTIRAWYDGYVFGGSALYCPWDVVNYVAALLRRPNAAPEPYWKDSSGNGLLQTFIDRGDYDVSDKFETLLNGGAILQKITESLTYDQLYDSGDNLWSVLFMTGYLTKADPAERGADVALRIPNVEIASIFQDTVIAHFQRSLTKHSQQKLADAFWDGDAEKAGALLTDLLWNTISYHDYHEDYYHAFLAGVFAGLGYAVESNREQGEGRPDILLKDRANRRALILEARKADSEGSMPAAADAAIGQIREKQYWKGGLDGYRTILCYGAGFYKKRALVKRMADDISLRHHLQ